MVAGTGVQLVGHWLQQQATRQRVTASDAATGGFLPTQLSSLILCCPSHPPILCVRLTSSCLPPPGAVLRCAYPVPPRRRKPRWPRRPHWCGGRPWRSWCSRWRTRRPTARPSPLHTWVTACCERIPPHPCPPLHGSSLASAQPAHGSRTARHAAWALASTLPFQQWFKVSKCLRHAAPCLPAQYPYYTFVDRDKMYTVGSLFYAIYFFVSFPMFYRMDEVSDAGAHSHAHSASGVCLLQAAVCRPRDSVCRILSVSGWHYPHACILGDTDQSG